LARFTVLLDRPYPDVLAAAGVWVGSDVRTVATASGTTVAAPEYAQAPPQRLVERLCAVLELHPAQQFTPPGRGPDGRLGVGHRSGGLAGQW
jgi:hypothetical protein